MGLLQKFTVRSAKKEDGFTLIELAISMIIIGLLAAGFFAALRVQQQRQVIEQQNENFNTAREGLREFIFEPNASYYTGDAAGDFNGVTGGGIDFAGTTPTPTEVDYVTGKRFPCPADPSAGRGDANYGREVLAAGRSIDGDDDDDNPNTGANSLRLDADDDGFDAAGEFGPCAVTGAIQVAAGPLDSPDDVIIGALPFRTLGLSENEGLDAYKQQYTYAVTAGNTGYAQYNTYSGTVNAEDHAGGSSDQVRFVIVSHGPSGVGAYLDTGAQPVACGASAGRDNENCDGDDVFVTETQSARRDAAGGGFYDDLASSSLVGVDLSDSWWAFHDTGGAGEDYIFNQNDPEFHVVIGRDFGDPDADTFADRGQLTIGQPTTPPNRSHIFLRDHGSEQPHQGYITIDRPDNLGQEVGIYMVLDEDGDNNDDGNFTWATQNEDAFLLLRGHQGGSGVFGSSGDVHDRFIFWTDGQAYLDGPVGIGDGPGAKIYDDTIEPPIDLVVDNGTGGGGNQTVAQFGNGAGSLYITHNNPFISGNMHFTGGNWTYGANGPGSAVGPTGGEILFRTWPTGTAGNTAVPTDVAIIDNAGNMGIGTTAPETILQLSNASPEFSFLDTSASNRGSIHFQDGDFQFWTNTTAAGAPSTTGSEILTIANNGAVGIGAATPTAELQLQGQDNTPVFLIRPDAMVAGEISAIRFEDPDGASVPMRIEYEDGTDALGVMGGRLGIGTRAPGRTLDVRGTVVIDEDTTADNDGDTDTELSVDGDIEASRDIEANTFTYPSDARLKTDLEESPGLESLAKLSPHTFLWKDNAPPQRAGKKDIGLIAQELQSIPELAHLVVGTEGDLQSKEYLKVNYPGLVPVLVQSIKDLKAENDALKVELASATADQNARIDELKQEIKALKDYVKPQPAKGGFDTLALPYQILLMLLMLGAGLGVGIGAGRLMRPQKQ